jgi:hypothetical protein
LRRVTQPPFIAGPLAQIRVANFELATRRNLFNFIVTSNIYNLFLEKAFAHFIPRKLYSDKKVSHTLTDFVPSQFKKLPAKNVLGLTPLSQF